MAHQPSNADLLKYGMENGIIPTNPIPGEPISSYVSRIALAGIALGVAAGTGALVASSEEEKEEATPEGGGSE